MPLDESEYVLVDKIDSKYDTPYKPINYSKYGGRLRIHGPLDKSEYVLVEKIDSKYDAPYKPINYSEYGGRLRIYGHHFGFRQLG